MVLAVKPLVAIVSDRISVTTSTVAVLVIVLMGTQEKHAMMVRVVA